MTTPSTAPEMGEFVYVRNVVGNPYGVTGSTVGVEYTATIESLISDGLMAFAPGQVNEPYSVPLGSYGTDPLNPAPGEWVYIHHNVGTSLGEAGTIVGVEYTTYVHRLVTSGQVNLTLPPTTEMTNFPLYGDNTFASLGMVKDLMYAYFGGYDGGPGDYSHLILSDRLRDAIASEMSITYDPTVQALIDEARDYNADTKAARDAAEGHASDASDSAADSLAYRNTAKDHRDAASASEIAAGTSESNAASSASAAATSESNAAQSEANALAYRNTAGEHSDTATTQAGIATTKAGEADASAIAAADSESAAAGSASAASTSAGEADASAVAADASANIATGKAGEASQSASDAAVSESNASDSAAAALADRNEIRTVRDDEIYPARDTAVNAASSASGSADSAGQSASAAANSAGIAENYATSFGLTVDSDTGAPGSNATATVTGDGPAYHVNFSIPQGEKGPQGDPGEVSQAMLDAAVASLVDGAPAALDTLTELADALGNDPNFATTVSTAIGQRALIDGAPAEYDSLGKVVSALIAGDLGGGESLVWTDGAGAFGIGTTDVGANGVAFGSSPVEGMPAASAGTSAAAVGPGASAGDYSAAIGPAASADEYAAAIGASASAGLSAAAVGPEASAGDYSAAIGAEASAGEYAAAIGYGASAGDYSAAIGPAASATGVGALAIGMQASTSNAGEIALGSSSAHVQVAGSLNVDGPLTTGGTPLTAAEVGLGNVNNTSDAAKPVSTATASALAGKVDTTDSRLTNARTPTAHTHPVTDLTTTGTASSSTYLRGDGTWATPTNTTYAVPTQAEAEAGTATTARAFSAQRVRQAANAAIAAREWVGTQAQYNAIGTKNPNITYYVVE